MNEPASSDGGIRERDTSQLAAPKDVSEEGGVVQAPNAVAACRLELIYVLQLPAQAKVAGKYRQDNAALLIWDRLQEAGEGEAEKEEGK
jgi:hypothetical protein